MYSILSNICIALISLKSMQHDFSYADFVVEIRNQAYNVCKLKRCPPCINYAEMNQTINLVHGPEPPKSNNFV